jgi:hypothetical protein
VVSLRRREFLGAIAGGLLIGGCAGETEPAVPRDADVLAPLLAGEYAALDALGDDPIAAADRRHVSRLRRAIAAAGGDPENPGGADPLPPLVRKQQNVFDYAAALPRLADPGLRVLVLELAAEEAEHLAALRLAAGDEPVPDAFAGLTSGAGA